jgi:REP element-mobilizing transposase RayT
MSRPLRDLKPNSFYHIYNRGNNKEAIFKTPADKQFFLGLLFRYRKACDIKIVAYCIMDNHFHLIARTGKEPKSLSKYMQKISVTFAMEINRKYQRVGHIFQGRYNAKYLEYKKDLIQVTRYVQQNPIREGLVKKASDYPWLSRN